MATQRSITTDKLNGIGVGSRLVDGFSFNFLKVPIHRSAVVSCYYGDYPDRLTLQSNTEISLALNAKVY